MQYMANKPDQFGIQFCPTVEVEFKYISNAISYLGKDEARPATQKLSKSVVIQIVEPYLGKGRGVTTDNFFTLTILPCSSGKKDVACRNAKQNLKGCSASGKSFTAEQIIQQTLANKKRQQLSHNLDSLPVQTKEESLYF